jgi:hypothetical protein
MKELMMSSFEQLQAFAELDIVARKTLRSWSRAITLRTRGKELLKEGNGHLPKGFQVEQPLEEEMPVEELLTYVTEIHDQPMVVDLDSDNQEDLISVYDFVSEVA